MDALTINMAKSGLSLGFFFMQRSTKSRMSAEKTLGNFGGGWLTMYSRSSKMAIGLAVNSDRIVSNTSVMD